MAEPFTVEFTDDLSEVIAQMRTALRSAYQCEPQQWVLNPHEYAYMQAHMDAGCEKDSHKAFWANCVKAEAD